MKDKFNTWNHRTARLQAMEPPCEAKSLTLLLIVAACHSLFFPHMAVAASRTLKAGDVLGISEHLILSGDDVLDVRGTATKSCRIDANGQQIKTTAEWRGWIKVNYCEFRSLGSAKLAALDLAAFGQGDKIIIENSAFHACGPFTFPTTTTQARFSAITF